MIWGTENRSGQPPFGKLQETFPTMTFKKSDIKNVVDSTPSSSDLSSSRDAAVVSGQQLACSTAAASYKMCDHSTPAITARTSAFISAATTSDPEKRDERCDNENDNVGEVKEIDQRLSRGIGFATDRNNKTKDAVRSEEKSSSQQLQQRRTAVDLKTSTNCQQRRSTFNKACVDAKKVKAKQQPRLQQTSKQNVFATPSPKLISDTSAAVSSVSSRDSTLRSGAASSSASADVEFVTTNCIAGNCMKKDEIFWFFTRHLFTELLSILIFTTICSAFIVLLVYFTIFRVHGMKFDLLFWLAVVTSASDATMLYICAFHFAFWDDSSSDDPVPADQGSDAQLQSGLNTVSYID